MLQLCFQLSFQSRSKSHKIAFDPFSFDSPSTTFFRKSQSENESRTRDGAIKEQTFLFLSTEPPAPIGHITQVNDVSLAI